MNITIIGPKYSGKKTFLNLIRKNILKEEGDYDGVLRIIFDVTKLCLKEFKNEKKKFEIEVYFEDLKNKIEIEMDLKEKFSKLYYHLKELWKEEGFLKKEVYQELIEGVPDMISLEFLESLYRNDLYQIIIKEVLELIILKYSPFLKHIINLIEKENKLYETDYALKFSKYLKQNDKIMITSLFEFEFFLIDKTVYEYILKEILNFEMENNLKLILLNFSLFSELELKKQKYLLSLEPNRILFDFTNVKSIYKWNASNITELKYEYGNLIWNFKLNEINKETNLILFFNESKEINMKSYLFENKKNGNSIFKEEDFNKIMINLKRLYNQKEIELNQPKEIFKIFKDEKILYFYFLEYINDFKKYKGLLLRLKGIDILHYFLKQNSIFQFSLKSYESLEYVLFQNFELLNNKIYDNLYQEVYLKIEKEYLLFLELNLKINFYYFTNESIVLLSKLIQNSFILKNRYYLLKEYKECFIATEAIDWMIKNDFNMEKSLEILNLYVKLKYIEHVVDPFKPISNQYLFFKFNSNHLLSEYPKLKPFLEETTDFYLNLFEFFKNNVEVKDREYHFKIYPQCFVGGELVSLLSNYLKISRNLSLHIGNFYFKNNFFQHCLNHHPLKDEFLFYVFNKDHLYVDKKFLFF